MEYDLDPDTLHEVAKDPDQMKQGLAYLQEKLEKETDELKKAGIQSLIGAFARIVGELETAESCCIEAVNFFEGHSKPVHLMLAQQPIPRMLRP